MSIHIKAKPGDLAETMFITGDPLRAKFLAEKFLDDVHCYNEVRGALGFTGYFNGKRVSVQGTGMGIPSTGIYVHEMIDEFGVKTIIRLGSCGSFQKHIGLRDIIISLSASTDSSVHQKVFPGMDYAPCADYGLVEKAVKSARNRSVSYHVGQILSSDLFYQPDPESWKQWAQWGTLAVEMETNMIYGLASRYQAKALSLLTVSDCLWDKTELSSQDRETGLIDMMGIGLDLLEV